MSHSRPRASTPAPPAQPPCPPEPLDPKSLSLIHRVLLPHHPPTAPINELLPALTSSAEVDGQLYAIVAILIRDFVKSWYEPHVSASDGDFVAEIVALIAHLTRGLEERIRRVDLVSLLCDEVPAVIEVCVKDFRTAKTRAGSALAPDGDVKNVFRQFQPHPILEDQALYQRSLSLGILSVLLPTEDLQSDVERSLLVEIVSNIVFGNLINRLSEPWFFHELIITLLRRPNEPPPPEGPPRRNGHSRGSSITTPPPPKPPPANPILLHILAITLTVTTTVSSVISTVVTHLISPPPSSTPPSKTLIRSSLPSLFSTLFNLPSSSPWLPTTLRLLSRPFSNRTSTAGLLIDDILRNQLTPLLTGKMLVEVLKLVRRTMFPGDAMGPPKKIPGEKAQIWLRKEAARVLIERKLPERWALGLLEAVEEREVNKVIVARVVEVVVGRMVPELEVKTGEEVKEERCGD